MGDESIQQKFTAALDTLISQIKEDRSILAAILCGSLSHDAVWAKCDIDLLLVTVDDKKAPQGERALYAGGITVHAFLIPRAELRSALEGSPEGAFMQSFVAKGRLLYPHDETIVSLYASL